MKRFTYFCMSLGSLLVSALSACGQKSYEEKLESLYEHTVPLMTPQALDSLQQQKSSVTLLDTRSPEEFEVSHLQQARFIDYDSFEISELQDVSKEDTVVLYCSVGYRSERIGEKLQKAGYRHVYNLYGGIFQWKNEGKEVFTPQNQPTDSVHTYNRNWSKWLEKGTKVY
uniref:Rhodanese-like domain-containing protein n=1 Tax=Roseihalotalea indica TaxID=2867963 RepID=A0AA49JKD2_9BACT|nr:rhodanese-like domain-containing protein [Tunicatimonas sp. TK19036]